MIILKIILFPFSLLYGLITAVRNYLFDIGLLKSDKVNAHVISIGNLSVGGTGKTPHVEYLINLLKVRKLAVLSRGYGRKIPGVILADEKSSPLQIGDEPYQYLSKFEVPVCVAEKRVAGAKMVLENTDVDTIILDDAYQHRAIERDINILVSDFNRPFYKDLMMPSGRLREFATGADRADAVIISKCPVDLNENTRERIELAVREYTDAPVFFSKVEYEEITLDKQEVVLVTGIVNSALMVDYLQSKGVSILKHYNYADHYNYTQQDVKKWSSNHSNNTIVTTDKDFSKISQLNLSGLHVVKLSIKVQFFGSDFDSFVLSRIEGAAN